MADYRDVIDGLNGSTEAVAVRAAALLAALENRGHSEDDIASFLNQYREVLSASADGPSRSAIAKITNRLITHLERNHKLVLPDHYRNQWMALGMAAFGVPLGVAFGLALDNMAFLGIGLPIGLSIGLALGSSMDQKAQQEGRQLRVPE